LFFSFSPFSSLGHLSFFLLPSLSLFFSPKNHRDRRTMRLVIRQDYDAVSYHVGKGIPSSPVHPFIVTLAMTITHHQHCLNPNASKIRERTHQRICPHSHQTIRARPSHRIVSSGS